MRSMGFTILFLVSFHRFLILITTNTLHSKLFSDLFFSMCWRYAFQPLSATIIRRSQVKSDGGVQHVCARRYTDDSVVDGDRALDFTTLT